MDRNKVSAGRVCALAIVLLLAGLLSGCGTASPSLIGTWEAIYSNNSPVSPGYLTCQFFQDGTVTFSGTGETGGSTSGQYTLIDATHIKVTYFGGLAQFTATYQLNGNTLDWTSQDIHGVPVTIEFTRSS